MAYSTDVDVQALFPDLQDYDNLSFSDDHARTQADIQRKLRISWFPMYLQSVNSTSSTSEMDNSKLTDAQFKNASVYHVLSYYILPKLSDFVEGDKFTSAMEFYRTRFEEEFDAILADGVEYDSDGDSTITNKEKSVKTSLYLRR